MRMCLLRFLSGATFAIISQHGAIAAGDGPQALLKGIKTIQYDVYVEATVGGDKCVVDQKALATSLQFTANQSTKLQIISEREHSRRAQELYNMLPPPSVTLDDKRSVAEKAARDYNFMPRLFIIITPLQQNGGCAGNIEATLSARIDSPFAKLIPTGASVGGWPSIEVWSKSYGFVHPQPMFSEHVTELAEQLIKAFANDWAAAQGE